MIFRPCFRPYALSETRSPPFVCMMELVYPWLSGTSNHFWRSLIICTCDRRSSAAADHMPKTFEFPKGMAPACVGLRPRYRRRKLVRGELNELVPDLGLAQPLAERRAGLMPSAFTVSPMMVQDYQPSPDGITDPGEHRWGALPTEYLNPLDPEVESFTARSMRSDSFREFRQHGDRRN